MKQQDPQIEILRKMTPQQKIYAFLRFYYSVWELKATWLKQIHKGWTEQQIHDKVKKAFQNAEL